MRLFEKMGEIGAVGDSKLTGRSKAKRPNVNSRALRGGGLLQYHDVVTGIVIFKKLSTAYVF